MAVGLTGDMAKKGVAMTGVGMAKKGVEDTDDAAPEDKDLWR